MAHANEEAQQAQSTFHHISVLPTELINGLAIKPGGQYLDVTLGGGGHTQLLLEAAEGTEVWGIDQDEVAIAAVQSRLSHYMETNRLHLIHNNFDEFHPGEQKFDGIIADLGVSSVQFDVAERGFSFRSEAPLDMRMNQQQSLTAAEIVNTWEDKELADLIYELGEERRSRRIARKIIENRPIETTTQLAYVVAGCFPPKQRHGRIHTATRTFQALRIAVNRELEVLDRLLEVAPDWLKPEGRIGIISFHSLEDRRVKHAFKPDERLRVITKRPLTASETELEVNPRSRSAKLRIAERRDRSSNE